MRLISANSLTLRLTLLFAIASSTVLLTLGFVIASSVETHFEEQDIHLLQSKLELTRYALGKMQTEADIANLPQQLDDALTGHHGLAIAVLGPRQEVIFATSGALFPHALLAAKPSERPSIWQQEGTPYRGIQAYVASGIKAWAPLKVAIATDISHHQVFMAAFRTTLWLFVLGAAILTGLLGWLAANRGLAPLRQMRKQTTGITAHHLGQRLPVDAVPQELAELAASLNDMLARLEDAFQRLSDFSIDIAHELRTPISNLMTQTQVALSKSRSAEDYRSILESNAEEYERLSKMIADMLFLARAENGLEVIEYETLDLAAEVQALLEFYAALAEDKGLKLLQSGHAHVSGDRLMLRRALSNLLSNAVRHTPAQGEIRISLSESEESASIAVGNSGESIAQEVQERLFDRFYRADPSRHRAGEGAGLGLAITQSIVVAHGGKIAVSSSSGWTEFSINIPLKQWTTYRT